MNATWALKIFDIALRQYRERRTKEMEKFLLKVAAAWDGETVVITVTGDSMDKCWKQDMHGFGGLDYVLFKNVPMRESKFGDVIDYNPGLMEKW